MEMNFLHWSGTAEKDGGDKKKHGSEEEEEEEDDDDMPSTMSLRDLSKVILPPLGVSSFTDGSKVKPNRWIISPMSSRYRYNKVPLTSSNSVFYYLFIYLFYFFLISPSKQFILVTVFLIYKHKMLIVVVR